MYSNYFNGKIPYGRATTSIRGKYKYKRETDVIKFVDYVVLK